MGIKTHIAITDLPPVLDCSVLTPTEHGVSDSVYLTDQGVLKLFESASREAVLEERNLLLNLSNLPVTKHSSDVFFLHEKPCVLYTKLNGQSLTNPNDNHIIQMAEFMRNFHGQTAGLTSTNTPLFKPSRLQALIHQTQYLPFQQIFDSMDIQLSHDGVIHGDLFLDNVLFTDDKLSGVFDFIEACEGDFLFDLAVVAVSWCLSGEDDQGKVSLLLTHYSTPISFEEFIPYMKYALLYYATTRHISHRDYQPLLNKIIRLDEYAKGQM